MEIRNAYKNLDRNPRGKKPFPRHGRRTHITLMITRERWESMTWIQLAQDNLQLWRSSGNNDESSTSRKDARL